MARARLHGMGITRYQRKRSDNGSAECTKKQAHEDQVTNDGNEEPSREREEQNVDQRPLDTHHK